MTSQVATSKEGKSRPGASSARPGSLNPTAPILAQPYKACVETGLMTISVTFEAIQTRVVAKVTPLAVQRGCTLVVNQEYAPSVVYSHLDGLGLVPPPPGAKKSKTGKTRQDQLGPVKSLCLNDFRHPESLGARIKEVAEAAGGGVLTGRVRSQPGLFKATQTISYGEWWEGASPIERLVSLTDNKNRQKIPETDHALLSGLPCPFQGQLDFVVYEASASEASRSIA